MGNTLLILGALLLGFGALWFFIKNSLSELQKPKDDEGLKLMLQVVENLRKEMNGSQQHVAQSIQTQFKQSASIIQEVTKNLTSIQETNQRVVGFAQQMQSLENILKSPKQRGILGEYALETLLSNHLHGNYEMQYKMKSGDIVDAAIHFNNLIIPIDSKFSLENYNKMSQEDDDIRRSELEKAFKADVKRRIDETSKYIRPQEGTTEFAFMFIPAEGVYYNLTIYSVGAGSVNTRSLMEYAFEKRVIIVSPSSFFAYLQTVLQGMKALEMGANMAETLQGIEVLGRHLKVYEEHMQKLGRSLGSAVSTYNQASTEYRKIDKDVYRLSEGRVGGDVTVNLLEKPSEVE